MILSNGKVKQIEFIFIAPDAGSYLDREDLCSGNPDAGLKLAIISNILTEIILYNDMERASPILDYASQQLVDDEVADVIDTVTTVGTLIDYHPHQMTLHTLRNFFEYSTHEYPITYRGDIRLFDPNTISLTLTIEAEPWLINKLESTLLASS